VTKSGCHAVLSVDINFDTFVYYNLMTLDCNFNILLLNESDYKSVLF
jgi:hypothetical protein